MTIETGNVVIEEQQADRNIALTAGRYVILAVSDTGCGVDKDAQTHIFEPFFTTKRDVKGGGLGLSTTYGIVEEHHGHIEVLSQPGKGTNIKIYLPRADVQPDCSSPRAAEAEVPHPTPFTPRELSTKMREALQR